MSICDGTESQAWGKVERELRHVLKLEYDHMPQAKREGFATALRYVAARRDGEKSSEGIFA